MAGGDIGGAFENELTFKHYYKSDSLIGSGTIKFRPYTITEPLPQLATVSNVSVDGTTVTFDGVENATSYEVFADGESIGTVENETEEGYTQVSVEADSTKNVTTINNMNKTKKYSVFYTDSPNYNNQGNERICSGFEYVDNQWTNIINDGLPLNIESSTETSISFYTGSGDIIDWWYGAVLQGNTFAKYSNFTEEILQTKDFAYRLCLAEGTQITLSDGSTKSVQDIRYGDKVLCYDFTKGIQTVSYIDWMIPERVATSYWEITLSDGTILNLVGSNGKSHRLYNVTKQRFDYPQDFEPNDITLKEDGTTAYILSCNEIEKKVKFYNIASHEHINVYANEVLTSNRLNNRFKIINNKFTDKKIMTDEEVASYREYLEKIKA